MAIKFLFSVENSAHNSPFSAQLRLALIRFACLSVPPLLLLPLSSATTCLTRLPPRLFYLVLFLCRNERKMPRKLSPPRRHGSTLELFIFYPYRTIKLG